MRIIGEQWLHKPSQKIGLAEKILLPPLLYLQVKCLLTRHGKEIVSAWDSCILVDTDDTEAHAQDCGDSDLGKDMKPEKSNKDAKASPLRDKEKKKTKTKNMGIWTAIVATLKSFRQSLSREGLKKSDGRIC